MYQALATRDHHCRQNIVSTSHTGKQGLGEIRDPADRWQATIGRAGLKCSPCPPSPVGSQRTTSLLRKPRRAHASACSVLILVRLIRVQLFQVRRCALTHTNPGEKGMASQNTKVSTDLNKYFLNE